MNKKISINLAAAIAIICIAVTFSITMILSMRIFDNTVSSVREKEVMYEKIAEIDKVVRADALNSFDDAALYDMLASGYLAGINDRYAVYYTATQYATYLGMQNGSVMGVGMSLVKDANSGLIRITRVVPGSPAEGAAFTKNMFISAVNGTDVSTLTASQVTALLRDESGTTVDVTYRAFATGADTTVTLRRAAFTNQTVEATLTDSGDVGYIRIYAFESTTTAEVDRAVRAMQDAGAQALVFDVRDVSSTNWDAACDVIDILCPTGIFARTTDKNGNTSVRGSSDATCVTLPMVVMTNEGTAAAAELFAVSLRNMNEATLTGLTTAGRWSVQCEPQRLSDGSAVAFTIATMMDGNDKTYDKGVEPDMVVELDADSQEHYYELTMTTDGQIKRAITVAQSLIRRTTVQEANSAVSSESVPADSSSVAEDATIGESAEVDSTSSEAA